MTKLDELKKMIAEAQNVSADIIDDNYNLKVGRFKTSAGSMILANMVKKVYGCKINANVSTFGELVKRIDGVSDASTAAMTTSKVPAASTATHTVSGTDSANDDFPTYTLTGHPICGIDIQEIDIFPEAEDYWKESFYTDNFTDDEIAYCITADSPRHSFAARWCIKEALHKCGSRYYDIPLKSIQVVRHKSGILSLEILSESGAWERLPFACSLSHADNYAVGMVSGFDRR